MGLFYFNSRDIYRMPVDAATGQWEPPILPSGTAPNGFYANNYAYYYQFADRSNANNNLARQKEAARKYNKTFNNNNNNLDRVAWFKDDKAPFPLVTYMGYTPAGAEDRQLRTNRSFLEFGINPSNHTIFTTANSAAPAHETSRLYHRALLLFCKENGIDTGDQSNQTLITNIAKYRDKGINKRTGPTVPFGLVHAIVSEEHWKNRSNQYTELQKNRGNSVNDNAKKEARRSLLEAVLSDDAILQNPKVREFLDQTGDDTGHSMFDQDLDSIDDDDVTELFNLVQAAIITEKKSLSNHLLINYGPMSKMLNSRGILPHFRKMEIRRGAQGLQMADEILEQMTYLQLNEAQTQAHIQSDTGIDPVANRTLALDMMFSSKTKNKELKREIFTDDLRGEMDRRGVTLEVIEKVNERGRKLIRSTYSKKRWGMLTGGLLLGLAAVTVGVAAMVTETGHDLVMNTISDATKIIPTSTEHSSTLSLNQISLSSDYKLNQQLNPIQELHISGAGGTQGVQAVQDWNAAAKINAGKINTDFGFVNQLSDDGRNLTSLATNSNAADAILLSGLAPVDVFYGREETIPPGLSLTGQNDVFIDRYEKAMVNPKILDEYGQNPSTLSDAIRKGLTPADIETINARRKLQLIRFYNEQNPVSAISESDLQTNGSFDKTKIDTTFTGLKGKSTGVIKDQIDNFTDIKYTGNANNSIPLFYTTPEPPVNLPKVGDTTANSNIYFLLDKTNITPEPSNADGFKLLDDDPAIIKIQEDIAALEGDGFRESIGHGIVKNGNIEFDMKSIYSNNLKFTGTGSDNPDWQLQLLDYYSSQDEVDMATILEIQGNLEASLTPENVKIIKARRMYDLLHASGVSQTTLDTMTADDLLQLKAAENNVTIGAKTITLTNENLAKFNTIPTSTITTPKLDLNQTGFTYTGASPDWLLKRRKEIAQLKFNINSITPPIFTVPTNPPTPDAEQLAIIMRSNYFASQTRFLAPPGPTPLVTTGTEGAVTDSTIPTMSNSTIANPDGSQTDISYTRDANGDLVENKRTYREALEPEKDRRNPHMAGWVYDKLEELASKDGGNGDPDIKRVWPAAIMIGGGGAISAFCGYLTARGLIQYKSRAPDFIKNNFEEKEVEDENGIKRKVLLPRNAIAADIAAQYKIEKDAARAAGRGVGGASGPSLS